MLFGTLQKRLFYRQSTALVLIALVFFFASTLKAERLPVKTYTAADGLLRDIVYRVRQDSRGFLWFCTQEGVSLCTVTALRILPPKTDFRTAESVIFSKQAKAFIWLPRARESPGSIRTACAARGKIRFSPFICPTIRKRKGLMFCMKTAAGKHGRVRVTGFIN